GGPGDHARRKAERARPARPVHCAARGAGAGGGCGHRRGQPAGGKGKTMTLEEIRREIDGIDAQLLPLLQRRMDCAKQVADYKAAHGLPVFNAAREEQILERVAAQAGEYSGEARLFYATLMEMSR